MKTFDIFRWTCECGAVNVRGTPHYRVGETSICHATHCSKSHAITESDRVTVYFPDPGKTLVEVTDGDTGFRAWQRVCDENAELRKANAAFAERSGETQRELDELRNKNAVLREFVEAMRAIRVRKYADDRNIATHVCVTHAKWLSEVAAELLYRLDAGKKPEPKSEPTLAESIAIVEKRIHDWPQADREALTRIVEAAKVAEDDALKSEVERLREKLQVSVASADGDVAKLNAEVERLTRDRDDWRTVAVALAEAKR